MRFDFRLLAYVLWRIATYPFRLIRDHLRIRKTVRNFDEVMSNPFASVTDVWICARAVHWASYCTPARRRWEKECDCAARVASEMMRLTGGRVKGWALYPELGP